MNLRRNAAVKLGLFSCRFELCVLLVITSISILFIDWVSWPCSEVVLIKFQLVSIEATYSIILVNSFRVRYDYTGSKSSSK